MCFLCPVADLSNSPILKVCLMNYQIIKVDCIYLDVYYDIT